MNVDEKTIKIIQKVTGPLPQKARVANCVLRRMQLADVDAVFDLEKLIFPSPWSRRVFRSEISKNPFSVPLVIERLQLVIAYSISWVVGDELHITNVAVAPQFRRHKLSEVMLERLFQVSSDEGLEVAHLEVRRSNVAAIALYQKLGFDIVGVRKGYYQDDNEDALLMTKRLDQDITVFGQRS